ncbi:hypothetical protein [Streptosporangium sp. NPDC087985]|uniref:hypothetical protein n=1 Tax=Streptosporangium sp. NPDC087985 TaxID=3366196 RepID=UPI0037F7ECF2
MLSRTGTLARVQWDDDGVVEENVRLGGENLLAVAGTRRHQFLLDLPALIERFTSDPVTVVVELLRESSKGLKAQAIKELLIELGLEPAVVDRSWRGVQAKLSKRDDVRVRANTYRWVRPRPAEDVIAPAAPPTEVGEDVTGPETPAPIRKDDEAATDSAETAEERARVLAERCERLERDLQSANNRAIRLRTAQERQLQIDVVRTLADLAAEIEEIVIGGTTPEIIVERVRSLVAGQALHPIGTVGEESGFDPALHEPLVGAPEPGTPVSVIRPGYRWATSEEILLHKALVEQV